MSASNARASLNRRIVELADVGVSVKIDEEAGKVDPCYVVEWLDLEVPRGITHKARNVRVHVRTSEGILTAEQRMKRLLDGLGLVNGASVASVALYDYDTSVSAPAAIGAFKVERSPRGVSSIPSREKPNMRHLVANLVVVYQ